MKTQREATYLLKSALSGGSISDDSPIPNRRLLQMLKYVLTQLNHRGIAKNIEFANESILVLPCISLTDTDMVECPSIPKSGLTWKKSRAPIPDFIKLISVTDILGNVSIPVIIWDKLNAHMNSRNKAVREGAVATFRNTGDGTYLYVLAANEVVSATIVPADYAMASLYPKCGEVSNRACDYWELPIGAPDNLIAEAIQFLKADEIKFNAAIKPDILTNDNPA